MTTILRIHSNAIASTLLTVILIALSLRMVEAQPARKPIRTFGFGPGILDPGPQNAITDVEGVQVGHFTLDRDDRVRTGVTAILPHRDNLFQQKVPAAVVVGNGFGKLAGSTQIRELGEVETPIVLTNTLAVGTAIDAVVEHTLSYPGNEQVRSVNAVVGETNDGYLNDIRSRPIRKEHVLEAIRRASAEPPEQGAVGAGRGTVAFGWKGGIGTSSRRLPESLGGFTIGVLVQSNYGGVLQILGAPVGQVLGHHYLKEALPDQAAPDSGDGSIMIVVATDAPLSDRNLERLARRALAGLAKTGSSMTNGSGDYVIAFSNAASVRRRALPDGMVASREELPNSAMSPLFQAVIEATEEAIYNSLFLAETVDGHRGTIEALPIDEVLTILRRSR